MKILIISQYFWPEEFIINDFASGLLARNHEVEVLTGLPNYPSGKFFGGYNWRGPYREKYKGITVWRSPLIPRGRAGGITLALNYLSFALMACVRGMMCCRRRFDIILVFEVSPITVGIPARLLKFATGAQLLFWVLDLWPESLSAAGGVRARLPLALAAGLTRWVYRGCDRVLIASRAFGDSVARHGGRAEHICYLPNFAEELYQPVAPDAKATERAIMPDGFRVMVAGNIGEAQDFETILDAAERTAGRSDIHWIILGDGRRRQWVEAEAQHRGLSNFHLMGRHPKETMPAFFSLAHVMLLSLKKEPIFALTVPAKLQSYFACGKPVIAALDGEGARIVNEAQAGLTVPASDAIRLADAVMRMADMDKALLKEMGVNARRYHEAHFTRDRVLDEFETISGAALKIANKAEI